MTTNRKPTYPIDSVFLDRWSPRSFLEKGVPEEVLNSLFEAARWAPSANNVQSWSYIVAKTPQEKEAFYSFIGEGNLLWCKKAPVLALALSKKGVRTHEFEAGMSFGYLLLEATNKGLITHPMGGFDVEKARKVLNISEDYDIHVVTAIGYQGPKEELPEKFQEREAPSDRKPFDELFYT